MGQTAAGSLAGSILDENGAAVPAADLVLTSLVQKTTQQAISSDAGLYVFPSVVPGLYSLTVTKTGFKKVTRPSLEIRIAQRLDLDVRLPVGDVATTVDVTDQAPLLEASTSERGQSFSGKFMSTLPLFTGGVRNPETFVAYMPGVNSGGGSFGLSEQSISGSGGRSKEILIDGASQTNPESGGVAFQFPSVEQFGEFKLMTSTYSAEYGRFGGGVEVFVTKSGTNDIHGGSYLNMRRDIWQAAGYNVNRVVGRTPGFRPKERFNEVGGVIGGPVFLPKLYDGRNKTFWFFTMAKDIRPQTFAAVINTIPTVNMKSGNFSQLPQAQIIYDPATTSGSGATATRTPFPGQIIPQNRISRIASKIVPLIPDANAAGTINNYNFINTTQFEDTHWSLKFDHAFSPNNRISYYMSRQNQISQNIATFPGPLGTELDATNRPQNFRINHDYVIRPNVLLHTTYGFTRFQQGWDNPQQRGFGSVIGLSVTGVNDAFPRVNFTGPDALTNWGRADGKVGAGGQMNWTNHLNAHLSWISGRHEIKVGGDVRRLRTFVNPIDQAGTNGAFTFARAQTANPSALATTGHPFASMLLGSPDSATQTALPVPDVQIRYQYYAGFIQDNWKVNSRLTLNLGARYEIPFGFSDANNSVTSFNPRLANPRAGGLPGALEYAGTGPGRSGRTRLYDTDFSNFGPRLGLAYKLSDKTVLRAGWGIYFVTMGNGGCGCREGFGATFAAQSDGLNPAFGWDIGRVPEPAGFQKPPFVDPSFANGRAVEYQSGTFGKAPRVYNWSVNLQHQLKSFLIDVAYVGNRGNGLNSTVQQNQLPTSRLGLGALLQLPITHPDVVAAGFRKPYDAFPNNSSLAQALRPFPQYLDVVGLATGQGLTWYDSMQAKVERRFGSWQMMTAYTWSKSLSTAHYRQIFYQRQPWAQDAYNVDEMKSYSPYDQPHVLNILNSYDLPIGKGHKWLNTSNRWLDAAVGGWTIASAQRYFTGSLLLVQAPNTLGNGVLFSQFKKANLTGTAIRTGVDRTTLDPGNPNVRWFNSGANSPFSIPGQYQLGSAAIAYNDFRNPPVFQENLSITKRFKIPVRADRTVDLVYRADAFNIFNRTNFGGIVSAVGNVNFGLPTGPQSDRRIITMGLRLDF
jgi:outer membrane receptor protein involved in Fe transport